MGEAAVQHCRCYALEAERRIGELLRETERNPGVRTKGGGNGAGGPVVVPPADKATLKDLGLTKNESAEAQMLAELPEEEFEQIKAGKKTKTKAASLLSAPSPCCGRLPPLTPLS